MLDKNNPIALLMSRICIGLSLPVRIFIKIISRPAASDAVSAIKAAGSNEPDVGRISIIEPANPISAATQRRGQDRIRNFRELPNNLDSFQEFADRIKEYTGRTEEQVLGALKYSIRQTSDGKWSWKWDPATKNRGRSGGDPNWPTEKLWECVQAIDCPSLVLRGDRSDIFAEETMVKMGEVMFDCTTETISNAGHLVQGDNPVDFIAAARGLLSRVNG